MNGLISAHSGLRWIALLLLVIAIINAAMNWNADKYTKKDNSINLFAMILLHVQLLIGIVLYFTSPLVQFNENTMSSSITRFFTMEHGLMMIIAIAIVTIGRIASKKRESPIKKHRLIFKYYLIGLIIIFFAIPWPFIYDFAANFGYF